MPFKTFRYAGGQSSYCCWSMCCTPYNICEIFGDYCLEDWEQVASEDDVINLAPDGRNTSRQAAASSIRDAIKDYLNTH